MCIYLFLFFLYLFLYIESYEFKAISTIPLLILSIITGFSGSEKPGSLILNVFTYLISLLYVTTSLIATLLSPLQVPSSP